MRIKLFLLSILFAFIYYFVSMPSLNPLLVDGAMFWFVLIVVWLAIINIDSLLKAIFRKYNLTDDDLPRFFKGMAQKYDNTFEKTKATAKISIGVVVVLLLAGIVYTAIGTPLFSYKAYREQMPNPKEIQFSEGMEKVDMNKLLVVDKELALILADKKLGERSSLGSQVVTGEPTIQQVNGELLWAVPLHHSGFFKWLSNMDGSAGYITVSATNMQDVKYVDDYKIKIQPNSYFFDDLTRRLRFNVGAFKGITDYSFELDEEGRPHWVVTTYKNKRGFSLQEANGVIIVDAQTGSCKSYDLDEIPEWVDRVQPEDYIVSQINNKGKYVHGIFNFSNKDKFQTSEGDIIVYNDNRCYLFTGITSVGADNSALGFYMVDMKTKEPFFFNMSGATENAAMQSAEGAVQDLGYSATFPVVLNLEKNPTYFTTLKDKSGLIKKYAFVSIKNYNIVGVGDNIVEAEKNYLNLLKNTGSSDIVVEDTKLEDKKIEGTVKRIDWSIVDNETVYSILLNENDKHIFVAKNSLSSTLPLTQVGDKVEIEYSFNEETITQKVGSFKNKTLGIE